MTVKAPPTAAHRALYDTKSFVPFNETAVMEDMVKSSYMVYLESSQITKRKQKSGQGNYILDSSKHIPACMVSEPDKAYEESLKDNCEKIVGGLVQKDGL